MTEACAVTKEGLTSRRAQPGPRDPVPLPLDLPTYRDDEHHTGYCQRVDAAESIHNRFGRCHVLVFRPNNDDVRLHAYAMCQGSHSLRTFHGEQIVSFRNKGGSFRRLCWMWRGYNDLCTPATQACKLL